MSYMNDFYPTPRRLLQKIEKAEELEEELDSLPPPLSSDASGSHSQTSHRPGDLFDVGISGASENNTILPHTQTQSGSRPSQLNPTPAPRPSHPNQQPTNMDAPQLIIDSPLTSTPATIHPSNRFSRHSNKPLATVSPNVSHIPQNRQAHQNENMMIISGSGTENDSTQPDTLQEDSSDSDHDLSKKSLGELNLSELDDYLPGLGPNNSSSPKNHQAHQHNIRTKKSSPQSYPSPSSSQSTLIPSSLKDDSQSLHPGTNNHSHESPESQIPSPGVGRRDSFHMEHSLSMNDIRQSFSNDVDQEFEDSKRYLTQRSQSFHPEQSLTPHHSKDQASALKPSGNFQARNILRSNFKPLQTQVPVRSARRTFVTRHLAEVAEDSTDLSTIPPHQSDKPNDFGPPGQLAESECDSTSHDLTSFPVKRHLNGNASFSFADQSHKFNGNKLNSFLHTLNGKLSDENHQMVNLLTETKAKLEQLKLENQLLRNKTGSHNPPDDPDLSNLPERSGAILNDMHDILDDSIAQLKNQIGSVQHEDKESPLLEHSLKNVLLDRQNRRLEDQLRQRDSEINGLRNQLVNKLPVTKSSLLKENNELKDHLSGLQNELSIKDDEVVRLRLQLMETSGQHASAVSELTTKYEQAQESLLETQQVLEDVKLKAENSRIEYETRMSALKNELSMLVTEQDNRLTVTNSKLKEARRLNDVQANELKDLHANQSKSWNNSDEIITLKQQLEQLLGDQSIGRSAAQQVQMMLSWLENEIPKSDKTNQDTTSPGTREVEASSQEIQRLRQQIQQHRAQLEELVQESSEKNNQVETLEKLLGESESARIARENEVAELEAQTDILEAKVVSQQATIKGLEVKLSHVLSSTFSEVSFTPRRLSPNHDPAHHHVELSKAQNEIHRLKGLLDRSCDPASSEIKSLKIKALEAHRDELEDRVGSLRRQASALMSTPSRSSIHFPSVISMRTPKTPGQFLGNVNSTLDSGDETIVPMLNQINELHQLVEQLRHQLDLANTDVDQKMEQLAEAKQESINVSTNAITAQKRAEELEQKSQLLEERLDRLIAEDGTIAHLKHRLSMIGCPECGEKFDANDVVHFRVVPEAQEIVFADQPVDTDTEDYSPTLRTKFQELEEKHQASQREIITQKRELDLKSDQLEQLESEKENCENEIEELNDQLSFARGEIERVRNELQSEQNQLKEILAKQQAVTTEKDDLESQIEAVNHELQQTRAQLSEVTEARDSMDAEIRALHQSIKDASHAPSIQIDQLQRTISKLEEEKQELSDEHASLMEEFAMLKSELETQAQLVNTQEKSYHRIQALLETHVNDANKLKGELESKSKEAMELKGLKDSLVQDTKTLRKELGSVKSEAQNLTQVLQQLKEQVNNQPSPNEITRIKNELSLCKEELDNLKTAKQSQHDFRMTIESTRKELEQKHNVESKGLLLRIRFLKLMFTRESRFRADLVSQKRLIMVKLHRTETANQAIHLALADFGLPSLHTHPGDVSQHCGNFTIHATDRSFKSIAIAVRAICKLKILSKNWSKEVVAKEKLKDAYRDARGKEFIGD